MKIKISYYNHLFKNINESCIAAAFIVRLDGSISRDFREGWIIRIRIDYSIYRDVWIIPFPFLSLWQICNCGIKFRHLTCMASKGRKRERSVLLTMGSQDFYGYYPYNAMNRIRREEKKT